ncbi:MAG: DNA-3-methyladenine glycosylase 2 family protein [SAR324 cluster bacterium]|nr:DNA-3-methyladenine glycosylase 2 family protein [SAR324 cluster bacterium]
MSVKSLNKKGFHEALQILREQDPKIDDILNQIGTPRWRKRRSGFPTLIRIILEQQVSLASGRAVFNRLLQGVPVLNPRELLKLDEETLRTMGFSRQKTRYCRILANAIQKKSLRLKPLEDLSDKAVRAELTKLTGIGQWTADIYLMEGLKRPDIWPVGDLALAIAVQKVLGLKKRPSPEQLEALGRKWKPWRAVAARVFWHQYLDGSF